MKLSDAIAFWVTENGYRQIQTVFSRRIHKGYNTYAQTHMLELNSRKDMGMVEEAIEVLQEAMEPGTKRETYYRGDIDIIRQQHLREGFFSVTRDPEKAAAYGDVFHVVLEKEVPRLRIESEGGEILVKDGMKYSFRDNTMYVSVPNSNNSAIPYLGSIYQSKKMENNKHTAIKLNKFINDLYCYSFEEPDEDGFYLGDCEESRKTEFVKLPLEERLHKLRNRLREMPHRDAFLESAPFFLGIDSSRLSELLKEVMQGGFYKYTPSQSKMRRTRKQMRRASATRKKRRRYS